MKEEDEWEFHHGDCVGADNQAHDIARKYGACIIIHPPKIHKLRAYCEGDMILPAKKYLDRDRMIVRASDTLVICPKQMKEVVRSGVWATYRYAIKLQKRVLVDGFVIFFVE